MSCETRKNNFQKEQFPVEKLRVQKQLGRFGENADTQDNLLTNLNKADFVLFVLNCLTFPHCGGEAQNKILTNIKPERTHRCRKEIRVRIYSFTYQTV
jgi:hypothetical protein